MNYLSKPITGLTTKISQLFSGRVISLIGSSSGLNVFQIPRRTQVLPLAVIVKRDKTEQFYPVKMTSRNFTPFPVLKTERLILRQLISSDDKEIFALRSNDNVNKYLDRKPSKSIDDAKNFINAERSGGWPCLH